MDSDAPRQERSWTLILHVACAMRDYATELDGGRMEKMTVAQERVLGAVYRCTSTKEGGDGLKLKDIASTVKLSPGAVSQIIEMLVQEGLVVRKNDPHDRRAVKIHPSEDSQVIRGRVIERFDKLINSVLEEKTPEEREAFIDILERILEKLAPKGESIRRHAGETLLSMEEFK